MFFKTRLIAIAITVACLGTDIASAQRPTIAGRSFVRDPSLTIRKPVESWTERKNRNVVMQQRDYSCGAAALATVLRFYWGHNVNESTVLSVVEGMLSSADLQERAAEGLTMADVKDAAIKMGYQASVGEVTMQQLSESKVPVILVIDLGGTNHFVVCKGIVAGCAFLADPIRGNMRISTATLAKTWVRNAILVVAPEGETKSSRSQIDVTYADTIQGYLNRQVIRRQVSGVTFR